MEQLIRTSAPGHHAMSLMWIERSGSWRWMLEFDNLWTTAIRRAL